MIKCRRKKESSKHLIFNYGAPDCVYTGKKRDSPFMNGVVCFSWEDRAQWLGRPTGKPAVWPGNLQQQDLQNEKLK